MIRPLWTRRRGCWPFMLLLVGACAEAPPKNEKPVAQAAAPTDPKVALVEGDAKEVAVPLAGSLVAFRLLFYSGSVDDPPGKHGLTALTAKLMAEGGTESKTYPELLRALYPMAAEISVRVDKEQTVFLATVHQDKAAELVPLLSEVVVAPRFSEPELKRIQKDLINDIEKRLRATDDENLGKEMLNLMLYGPEHPYGHYVGGSVGHLKTITRDEVVAHAAKVFGRKRLLIGYAGAVAPELGSALAAALKDLPDGEPRLAEVAAPQKPDKNRVWIAEKPGKASAISLGFVHQAFRGHPDFSALSLVQSYFGEHRQFHGVLMSQMREKRGLNYGDYAYVENFVQEGWSRNPEANVARRRQHFEIWIRPVDPKDAVFATRLALFELSRLTLAGLSESAVKSTALFLDGYTRLFDLTPSRKLGYALDDHFYSTKSHLQSYRQDLAKLDEKVVNAAIKRHLAGSALAIAFVAPDALALKAALVSGEKAVKAYDSQKPAEILAEDERVAVHPLSIGEAEIRVMKAEELFEN